MLLFNRTNICLLQLLPFLKHQKIHLNDLNITFAGQFQVFLLQYKFTEQIMAQLILNKRNQYLNKLFQETNESFSQNVIIKIDRSNLRNEQLGQLIHSIENYKDIKIIELQKNQLTQEAITLIKQRQWRLLQHLDLWSNRIGWMGCQQIYEARWNYLEYLDLGYNNIGQKGAKYLSKCSFYHLKELGLTDTGIMDEGVSHLAKNKWKNLRTLFLRSNNLTNLAIRYLKNAQLKSLLCLDLSHNSFQEDAIESFILCSFESIEKCHFVLQNIVKNTSIRYQSLLRQKFPQLSWQKY